MRKSSFLFLVMLVLSALLFACTPSIDEDNTTGGLNDDPTTKAFTNVTVRVNGRILSYQSQPAVFDTTSNRTLVPLNETLTRCGFTVSWNDSTKQATCIKGVNKLVFTLNSVYVLVSNKNVTNTYYAMGCAAQLINNKMMVPVHALSDYTPVTSAYWDKDAYVVNIVYWDELYIGLDWLGTTGSYWRSYQSYVPGESNRYYNPSKPTIIFIHGWQNTSVGKKYYPDLALFEGNATDNIWGQNYWISKGWNVGVFQWTQLADEPFVWDAESKMWSATYGDQKMQWRNSNGDFIRTNMLTQSVGKILYDTVVSALSNQTGEVRIVGHSLGAQLATRLTRDLIVSYGTSSKYTPKRLTVLDPAAGSGAESYLAPFNNNVNISTGNLTTNYGTFIAQRAVPIEFYRTSNLMSAPGSDYMNGYERLACYTRLYPDYTSSPAAKHSMPIATYFWSMDFAAPKEVIKLSDGSYQFTGATTASASATNTRIREMMGTFKWVQAYGKTTENPSDDYFEKTNW